MYRPRATAAAAILVTLVVSACDGPDSTQTRDNDAADAAAPGVSPLTLASAAAAVRRAVRASALEVEEGTATYYADMLDRRRTASGEPLDQEDLVAAHRAYPFGTRLRVTNVENDRSVEVRVIDRGPFGGGVTARPIIDLSRRAARQLDFLDAGRVRVRVEVLEWGRRLQGY